MLPLNLVFYNHSDDMKKAPKATRQKVVLIEQSEFLCTVEKVNLIVLLLGYKQVTDIAIGRKNDWGKIKSVLDTLEVVYQPNHYTNDKELVEWLQVAINQSVLNYVIDRRDRLTVLEAGVLYGYPASACLAYDGMLEKKWFDKTLSEHWLSGVFSKAYTAIEREHFERVWTKVADLSPAIAAIAQQEYEQELMRHGKHRTYGNK